MLRIYVKNPAVPESVVVADTVKYGYLYNWYAATDARLICADGWDIPTKAQLETLIDYVEPGSFYYANINVGKILKENSAKWGVNTGTNDVLFNGVGAGHRSESTGVFSQLNTHNFIWSKTPTFCLVLTGANNNCNGGNYVDKSGRSIRPIKTTTTLTHGQSGLYVGNDGKVYRTICIGTQEWLADNLCETKFRNGDYIPGFDAGVYTPFSNAAWAGLTTAALCAYNDDLNNV